MELSFKITNTCNLNCSYCFEKEHPKKGILTENQIIEAIREIKQLNYSINRLSIFGGEPLLYPDLIDFIIKSYLSIIGPPNEIFIYTNGTIFNKKIEKIITSYTPLILQISLDGNKNAQNTSRASFDIILNNIDLFKSALMNTNNKLIFYSVWTKNIYPYIIDSVLFFFESLKLKKLSPLFIRESLSENDKNTLYNQLQYVKSYCTKYNKEFIVKTYQPFSICKIARMITVTPDEVTPCHRFNYTTLQLRFNSIKQLVTSDFYKYLLNLKYISTYHSKCFTCLYKKYCYHCPMEEFYNKGTFLRDFNCDVPKILYSVFEL